MHSKFRLASAFVFVSVALKFCTVCGFDTSVLSYNLLALLMCYIKFHCCGTKMVEDL